MQGFQQVNLQTTVQDLAQQPQIQGGDGAQKGSVVSIMTIAVIALVAILILMILYGGFADTFAGFFWTFASVGAVIAIVMIILAGLQMAVQLYPQTDQQKSILKDKNFKNLICSSFEHALSKFGLFYRGKCIKKQRLGYFEYVCSEKIQEKDKSEVKTTKHYLEKWNGELLVFSGIMQRTPTPQQDLYILNDIKAEIKLPELHISETKRIKFITDPITPYQRIQSTFKYKKYRADKITYHIFDEVNHAWSDQLVYITLNYFLPMKYWKYQLFNLLHLLEHCLLQKNKDTIYYNGQTFYSGGFMQLELILPKHKFRDWVSDYNNLIKSKHLNFNLEIQRLGEEMEQMIDIDLGLEFPEIAFNSDIYDHNLSGQLLYSLFTLLDLQDVIIQNVGPREQELYIPKFIQPAKFEEPLLKYFHQPKFLVKQLTTFSNNDFFKIKLDSKEEMFYISYLLSGGGALIFVDYPYIYIKRGFVEGNFVMYTEKTPSGNYYSSLDLFDSDFRFFTFNSFPFYMEGLTNEIIQRIQYSQEIFIPIKYVNKYEKIIKKIEQQKVSFL